MRFRENTVKFVDLNGRIIGRIEDIKKSHADTATPALDALLARFGGVLSGLHERDAMRKTFDATDEPTIGNDEAEIPPVADPVPLGTEARPEPPLTGPKPMKGKAFEQLADEYATFFLRSQIRPDQADLVRKLADKAFGFKATYEAVGKPLNIPWWWIAGVHLLESSFNFTTHLHNGDPLNQRTSRVPAGRPKSGSPPFSWQGSARDALDHHKLANLTDWSLPRALWRWERYNGFGYRGRGVPTPYLWSFTTIYESGKFVADGKFVDAAVSKQCGAAALLKALHEAGRVPELALDVVVEDETSQPDADADIGPVVDLKLPNIDGAVPAADDFQAFFQNALPDIRHFEWHEFLVKGASHVGNSLNIDPPPELWGNVIALARVLDAFREAMGKSVVLTSVYRSPAYNKAIGGASRSQHMAFTAADLKVAGGNTGQWAEQLKKLRQQGLFEGGIGIYNSFVHVDTRGTRVDWDKR